MAKRIMAAVAIVLGMFAVLVPGTAAADPAAPDSAQAHCTGFCVNLYNGSGHLAYIKGEEQGSNRVNVRPLPSGWWSRTYTGNDVYDVDWVRMPGCRLFVQGRWYPAGEWARVYGLSPAVYLTNINC